MTYEEFLKGKSQLDTEAGFAPLWMPDFLFPFQSDLIDWHLRHGRSANFADCGLGKTPMALVWAQNVVIQTNKPVLIATPLAVAQQFVSEGEKFGVQVSRSREGERPVSASVVVTNYERLHYFNPHDYAGFVCDESSILKSFDGARRSQITEFMRKIEYRHLCTATAAPNDYFELGTSSEALGQLGHMDMLMRFFKNDQNTIRPMAYRQRGKDFKSLDDGNKWRFKGHAEIPFWQWICSWARAVRRPSDLGYLDDGFILPELIERQHEVEVARKADGMLFTLPAIGLTEVRDERRRSIEERCGKVSELVNGTGKPFVSWCHLNDEGNLLAELCPDAVQVSGKDSDDEKEEKLIAFASGRVRGMIIKPKIGALGLNWQHCAHVTTFPSHSFEQYYQAVRRCLRFGQKNPVTVDIVTTEGDQNTLANLKRKADAADSMFTALVAQMNDARTIKRSMEYTQDMEVPQWL